MSGRDSSSLPGLNPHTGDTDTGKATARTAVIDGNIDRLSDDSSAIVDLEIMDHAPTTSHGTYLDGIDDGIESLEDYTDGGFHPIHLGDCFGPSDRYRVLHKLGYGGFGTVWLCRDGEEGRYVALKVMVGDAARDEVPDLAVTALDRSLPGAEYVCFPISNFTITGPNGDHHCVVLPLLGPRVSPRLWMQMEGDPGPVLRRMVHQTVQAMDFLHENAICHGDFRPSNILVKLANLDHLTEADLMSALRPPEPVPVRTESGDDLPASSPRYLVPSADLSRIDNAYLTDQICVVDFGESYPFSSPPKDIGIPETYLPPELLLEIDNESISPACDLWALGCTLFEIRQQIPLFYMIYGKDEILAEMVRFLGKLPATWWEIWDARGDFFDDNGTWIVNSEDLTLEVLLNKTAQVFETGIDLAQPQLPAKVMSTPEPEQRLMADLLHKLLRYDPQERITVKEVLKHEWFKI